MAKTIDSLVTFVPITSYKIDINEFTCLRVKACYDKGYGFRAGFVPAWGNEYCWGCCIDGSDNPLTAGIRVDVEPAKKNNAKRLMEIIGNLGKAKEIIAALFDDREWDKLRGVLHNVGRYGYTDAFRQQAEKMLQEREAKSETTEQKSNNSNSETTMEKKTKAADLIGKTIVNGNMKYVVIEAIDDEKIKVEFTSGDRTPVAMPMRVEQVDKLLAGGWKFADGTTATEAKSGDDVEEVEDIKPEAPKAAKTVGMNPEPPKTEKPKAKTEKPKAKADETKAAADGGKLVYSTYKNGKGKECARISGFADDQHPVYQAADTLHASSSYETRGGKKSFYLCFGPRYAAAAKDVCDALNAGKSLADCKDIIDKATEERAARREAWKQKREERKAGKTYTEQEVVDLVERIVAGDKAAMDELNAMKKAA